MKRTYTSVLSAVMRFLFTLSALLVLSLFGCSSRQAEPSFDTFTIEEDSSTSENISATGDISVEESPMFSSETQSSLPKAGYETTLRVLDETDWLNEDDVSEEVIERTRKDYELAYKWVTVSGVSDGMDAYEAATLMKEFICNNVSFDASYTRYHFYDIMEMYTGVCDAICELYMVMCKTAGIDCVILEADTAHCWNKVYLGDLGWMQVDVLWLDGPRSIQYEFSSEGWTDDNHIPSSVRSDLPLDMRK